MTVTNLPLYFKVQSITISAREKSSVSGASRVLYQLSGSTDASGASDAKTLGAGDGLLVAAGMTVDLKPIGGASSTLLQFLLSPASAVDRSTVVGTAVSNKRIVPNGGTPRSEDRPV